MWPRREKDRGETPLDLLFLDLMEKMRNEEENPPKPDRRLSRLQLVILKILNDSGGELNYRGLKTAAALAYGRGHIPSFAVSFSRSLRNLEEKGLVKLEFKTKKGCVYPHIEILRPQIKKVCLTEEGERVLMLKHHFNIKTPQEKDDFSFNGGDRR
ncbi:MAG: hypothetical protein SBU_000101 [Candidatus Syntrophoarchaeum butanivorans]|uniref:Uncharacterized protein n=1 Tax=Candidatus Syntropharchaeum butanivorans TaxID=1839936 RepID=A0A1F2P6H4_9EURY|nr:MAG: hypothetical protein SBU_000101 [Candidatus Syntrophoarchaeum butanivorans]